MNEFMWLVLMEGRSLNGNTKSSSNNNNNDQIRWEMKFTPILASTSALLTGCYDAASAAVLLSFLTECYRPETLGKLDKVDIAGFLSGHCLKYRVTKLRRV